VTPDTDAIDAELKTSRRDRTGRCQQFIDPGRIHLAQKREREVDGFGPRDPSAHGGLQ
jgi:hypothetical protein